MTALAIPELGGDLAATYRSKFDGLTNEQVCERIRGALRMTTDSWLTVAYGVQVLEERGEDVDRIRSVVSGPLLTWLRRIAGGQLRPELICRFYNQSSLIHVIGRLPAPDQLKLAAGGRIGVLVMKPDGGYTARMLTPDEMLPDQIRQAFAVDHIRSEQEQAAWLDGKRAESVKPVPESIGPFRIDRERKLATFAGKRGDAVDESTLAAVLRAIRR